MSISITRRQQAQPSPATRFRWLRAGVAAVKDSLRWCFDAATDAHRLHASSDSAFSQNAETQAASVANDPEFDGFFTQFEQALFGYIRRMVPSEEVAVEITQETFFRAWQHFATLRTYERPQAWLYKVATRLALNHRRDTHTISFTRYAAATQDADVPGMALEETMVDALDVEQQTVERDLINYVLRQLPANQRAALLLRAVYGLSSDEIAQALDLSPAASRKTLSRARERFRELFDAAQQA